MPVDTTQLSQEEVFDVGSSKGAVKGELEDQIAWNATIFRAARDGKDGIPKPPTESPNRRPHPRRTRAAPTKSLEKNRNMSPRLVCLELRLAPHRWRHANLFSIENKTLNLEHIMGDRRVAQQILKRLAVRS